MAGEELWCIGGYRPLERSRISLLVLHLGRKRWDDLTPTDDAKAPCWRWGHAACVLGKGAEKVMICGGFDRNCNHNDAWYFLPSARCFSEPPRDLQTLPFHGAYHSLVYEPFAEEAYLFGGQCCVAGPYVYSNSS